MKNNYEKIAERVFNYQLEQYKIPIKVKINQKDIMRNADSFSKKLGFDTTNKKLRKLKYNCECGNTFTVQLKNKYYFINQPYCSYDGKAMYCEVL